MSHLVYFVQLSDDYVYVGISEISQLIGVEQVVNALSQILGKNLKKYYYLVNDAASAHKCLNSAIAMNKLHEAQIKHTCPAQITQVKSMPQYADRIIYNIPYSKLQSTDGEWMIDVLQKISTTL